MRTPTCLCGECQKCKHREYLRAWRAANPDYMPNYLRDWQYQRDPDKELRDDIRKSQLRFTPEQDALLGTDTDIVIAQLLGKTGRAIHKRRRRLGIPAYVKRGQRTNARGYVSVVLAPDDPLVEMTRSGRSVMEHRLVMARYLGRPLVRDELVHHRNGIRDDNRIENLELWSRSHPDGQRVEDILVWARDFISRYDHESLQLALFRPS